MDGFEQDRFSQDRLDQELRDALRRQKPSHDFEVRVAARVARAGSRRSWWASIWTWPQLRWAAAAALCLLIVGGITYQHEQRLERARGEAAKQQVMIALRIAGSKVQLARAKLQNLSQR